MGAASRGSLNSSGWVEEPCFSGQCGVVGDRRHFPQYTARCCLLCPCSLEQDAAHQPLPGMGCPTQQLGQTAAGDLQGINKVPDSLEKRSGNLIIVFKYVRGYYNEGSSQLLSIATKGRTKRKELNV